MDFLLVNLLVLSFSTFTFGQPGRIIGAEDANIEDYPHQMALLYSGLLHCGGSILNERYVVTAAHCVKWATPEYLKILTVRAGSSYWQKGGQLRNISAITIHSQYASSHFDVAIIKLSEPLEFNELVTKIELADNEINDNTIVTLTGWGTTEFDNQPFHLKVAKMPVVNRKICQNILRKNLIDVDITENIICAGGKNTSGCHGDSGGPLIYDGKLYGIVSGGDDKCKPSNPGMFGNVNKLRSFIESNIE